MKTYIVEWAIDVDADSPHSAAVEALKIQRDRESTATCFTLLEQDGDGTQHTVDLEGWVDRDNARREQTIEDLQVMVHCGEERETKLRTALHNLLHAFHIERYDNPNTGQKYHASIRQVSDLLEAIETARYLLGEPSIDRAAAAGNPP